MSLAKIDTTLKQNDFPHRFYVKYAVACAKLALANDPKPPHPDSLKALALAERFSLGENIPQEELKAAADAAYAYAYAAYTSSDKLYELLLTMIDNEFSELEKILLNIREIK